jgi:hypothetical protein
MSRFEFHPVTREPFVQEPQPDRRDLREPRMIEKTPKGASPRGPSRSSDGCPLDPNGAGNMSLPTISEPTNEA